MATISKITVQKRNKSRYNLFIDRGKGEEYAFSIDEDLLIKYQLKKGMKLDDEQFIRLIDEDEQKKTYFLAINYLSYRMRSAEEVRTYLQKKERNEVHIEAAITKLKAEKYLNDDEFAIAYVRTKKRTTLKGPRTIRNELKDKGVSDQIVDNAMNQFAKSEQLEAVKEWLEKQLAKQHTLSHKGYMDKLKMQLLNKGFTFDTINEAFDLIEVDYDASEEWDNIQIYGEKIVRKYRGRYNGWEFHQRVKQALYRKGYTMELIERFLNERDEDQ